MIRCSRQIWFKNLQIFAEEKCMKIWIASLIFISELAFAQLDPSSGLLLNSDPKSSHLENGLDSGRYTVRKKINLVKGPDKSVDKSSERDMAKSEEVEDAPTRAVAAPVVTAPVTAVPNQTVVLEQQTQVEVPHGKLPEISVIPETVSALSVIDEAKKNIVEISIAPVFIYNHSTADISTRNYSISGPAYLLDVGAWIQPSFALHAQILNSLSSSVNDSYDNSRNANLNQQWISAGFRYRNFLSTQKNAASISLGADYEDYQFQVDTDARIRNRIETSGVNLSLSSEIPQSSRYSWELGIEFMPKAKHLETMTSANIQSGNSPQANMIGINIGGKIYIDSSNQMFWKISERLEKDQFSGDSSKPDPATNQTQTNVSVSNTFTMIEIGYTWGN